MDGMVAWSGWDGMDGKMHGMIGMDGWVNGMGEMDAWMDGTTYGSSIWRPIIIKGQNYYYSDRPKCHNRPSYCLAHRPALVS